MVVVAALGSKVFSLSFNDLDLTKAASGSVKLAKAAAGLSDEEEIRVGRGVAAWLAGRYDLSENEKQTRYVNLIGRHLASHSSRPDLPYRFGILKTKEINAWAAPGGYVFVTEGLLGFLQDEAELAGVLAHEISHVTERHVVKEIRRAKLIGAGEDFISAAGGETAYFDSLSNFSIELMDKGLSRKDELESDRLGTLLAAKAGYAPQAFRDSVARLSETRAEANALTHFARTHPPTPERLKIIDAALPKTSESSTAPRLSQRFNDSLKN